MCTIMNVFKSSWIIGLSAVNSSEALRPIFEESWALYTMYVCMYYVNMMLEQQICMYVCKKLCMYVFIHTY